MISFKTCHNNQHNRPDTRYKLQFQTKSEHTTWRNSEPFVEPSWDHFVSPEIK